MQRQECLLAAELTQALRGIVIELMLALNGIRRPGATRNLNTYLSANQRTALERTLAAPNAAGESWIGQAIALLVIYRWYAPQLCARFKLTYPQALEDEVWQALRTGIFEWPASITSDPDSPLNDQLDAGPHVDDHPNRPRLSYGQSKCCLCCALRTGAKDDRVGADAAVCPAACGPRESCPHRHPALGYARRRRTHHNQGGVELVNVTLSGGIPLTVGRMLHTVDDLKPDIVHIVKPRAHAGLVQWRLWQKRRRPPLVLDMDDWEQAWSEINDYNPPVGTLSRLARRMGHSSRRRHYGRQSVAGRAGPAYAPATPILYLPNGVDVTKAPAAHAEAPAANPSLRADCPSPTVLFFSRYVEVEPDWLAACWHTLHTAVPDARLVVAGNPLQPGRDERFMAAMTMRGPEAAKAVEWRGFVPPASLPDLYANSTVAIFPAAPTSLQEAKCSVRLATTLLNGVPVVASSVGEQRHYGANGAAKLVAADATPEEFAASVAALLADAASRRKMIDAAAAHLAANYRWQDLGMRLERFYGKVLAAT